MHGATRAAHRTDGRSVLPRGLWGSGRQHPRTQRSRDSDASLAVSSQKLKNAGLHPSEAGPAFQLTMQIHTSHKSTGVQPSTKNIEKACEAAKAHELLTARILRFCKAAKDLGIETEDFVFDGSGSICFGTDRAANLR